MKAFPRFVLACALFLALSTNALAFSGVPQSASASSLRRPVRSAEQTTSVVVGFNSRTEAQAVNSALHLGGRNLRRAKSGRLAVVQVPPGANVADFVRELGTQPGVQYAEPDSLVYSAMASNDPGFIQQWGMTKIGVPAAWDITRGAAVKVAVVDSGVDLTHPDLVGHIDTANQYDFVNGDAVAQDDDSMSHGTHVAGIIGATLNNGVGVAGVANESTILPVKVMGANGTGSSSEVAMGILWAADHGADVINLSLGGTANSTAIDSAVQYAVSKDCVVVAAAGNEGSNAVYYPAADANVIGVGATDGHDARSTYSNYGPRVDITAPGDSVYSTIRVLHGSYGYLSGTSMATPHVAGVVALIRAKNPTWARQQVEEQLLSTALDLGAPGRDDSFGYGRVRADLAVGDTVPGGAITGTVSHGGGSLAGVSVSVPDHAPVLTAADGSYTVSGIVPSTYNVTYAKAGYSGQTVRATVLPSATTTQDVSLEIAVAVQSPTPKPVALSTPKVSGLASAHRGTTLKGTLIPAHSKRLTVQVRRLVNHRWRAYGSTTVASDKTGSWHVRLRLRRATYSVRVVSAADAVYSAGASSWRTVRVR